MGEQNQVNLTINNDISSISININSIAGYPQVLQEVEIPFNSLYPYFSFFQNDKDAKERLEAYIKVSLENTSASSFGITDQNRYINQTQLAEFVSARTKDFVDNYYDGSFEDILKKDSEYFDLPLFLSTAEIANSKKIRPYNPNEASWNIGNDPTSIAAQSALAARQVLLDPTSGKSIGTGSGTLVDTITGADLSVFFMIELPDMKDVIDKDLVPSMWQKKLMMIEMDSVMSLSYSIMREVYPVRAIGLNKPKSFVRGPTTISASIAFTVFTDDVLVRLRTQVQQSIKDLQTKNSQILKNLQAEISKQNTKSLKTKKEELKKLEDSYYSASGSTLDPAGSLASSLGLTYTSAYINDSLLVSQIETTSNEIKEVQKDINSAKTSAESSAAAFKNLIDTYSQFNSILNTGGIFMLNQLMPFHILVMGTTERGVFTKMMLKNIRVIDENQMQGVQQPNIVNRISLVAEDIFPLVSGSSTDSMDFTAVSTIDQDRMGGTKMAIYSGSSVMKDINTMVQGQYKLSV
jgi:hypothetical protein